MTTPLTREQVEKSLDKIAEVYEWKHVINYLRDHDAALRQSINQQAQEIERLKAEHIKLQAVISRQRVNLSRKYLGWAETKLHSVQISNAQLQAALASYADTVERVRTLESHIRETCGVELNALSNMGIGFVEKAVKWYQAAITAREAQLPKEMLDCTIRFRECQVGHGWLTATNWIDHACLVCERDDARQNAARLERELRQRMWTLHYSRMQHAPYGDDGCLDCHTCGRDYAKASMDELQQWELQDASQCIQAVEQAQRALNPTASPSSPQSP